MFPSLRKYWVGVFLSIMLMLLALPPFSKVLSAAVNEIIVVPRNYIFTWGSSGASIAPNTVYCSANSDFTRVLYWRTSDTNSAAGVNDWNPDIVVAGEYDIYVYIPDYSHYAAVTTQAKYYFNNGDGGPNELLATVDQNQNKCGWVHIGRRWFDVGTGETIWMPAQTPDNPWRLIAGDGMKFVYVSPPTYSISGRVTDSNNYPFASVTIMTNQGSFAVTDNNGNFTIAYLSPGTYVLTPNSVNNYTFSPASRTVTIAPNATDQNFTITNRYWITGRLLDVLGNPISGVDVVCTGLTTQLYTTTNSTGTYAFYGLVAGLYQVRPVTTNYQFSPRVSAWMFVPPNAANVNFYTQPVYGSISGQVTREGTSNPVANATVNVAGKSTRSDASGNYTLTSLLPGTHTVYVTADGFQNYQESALIQAGNNTVKNIALKPVLAEGYRLPFPGGTTYRLTRTAHPSGYAQDWARGGMNADDIVASRAGKVVQVKESSNTGGCSTKYLGKENYVTILHADNTKTIYVHLKQWSVPVNVGNYVKAGQVIGKSGRTGYSCGEHLHFAWMVNGRRAVPSFLDIPGGVPQVNQWYTSGNYIASLSMASPDSDPAILLADTTAPVGSLQFRLTGQATYQVQIETFDYESSTLQMRLATTEEALASTDWTNVTDMVEWSAPIIWGQFKDESGNLSPVYSDTIEEIAYESIQAAFSVEANVCSGSEPVITNETFPLCVQCGWQWDYGDGNTSQLMNPTLPYLTAIYTEPGIYTVTLAAANVDSTSSVSHQITVVPSPMADFLISRNGNTVTVESTDPDANSWNWDFGDGGTATGQTASHTYADTATFESSTVMLEVQNNFGCPSVGFQSAGWPYKLYTPVIVR